MICKPQMTCYVLYKPKENENFLLPPEIASSDYSVDVHFYKKGSVVKQTKTQCKGHQFCELIQCMFCLQRIFNPHCMPKYVTIIFIIIAILFFVLLWMGLITIVTVLTYILYITSLFCKVFKHIICKCCIFCCRKLFQKKHSPTQFKQTTPIPSMRRKRKTKRHITLPVIVKPTNYMMISLTLIMLSLQADFVNCCSEATTLTAKSTQCVNLPVPSNFPMIKHCSFNEVTRLALAPQNQEICLHIEGLNNTAIGTLKLKIQEIKLICQANNEYFTRSFHMHVNAVKRCAGMGSCTGNKCTSYNKDSKITEISEEANKQPGITKCIVLWLCWLQMFQM